jgi:hypothetical protein
MWVREIARKKQPQVLLAREDRARGFIGVRSHNNFREYLCDCLGRFNVKGTIAGNNATECGNAVTR